MIKPAVLNVTSVISISAGADRVDLRGDMQVDHAEDQHRDRLRVVPPEELRADHIVE